MYSCGTCYLSVAWYVIHNAGVNVSGSERQLTVVGNTESDGVYSCHLWQGRTPEGWATAREQVKSTEATATMLSLAIALGQTAAGIWLPTLAAQLWLEAYTLQGRVV